MLGFELAAGTIIGRDHRETGKNNHDAMSWLQTGDCIIAIVCDGCSAGAHSEVGAKIIARMLIESVRRLLLLQSCTLENHDRWWERIRLDILAQLRVLGLQLGPDLERVAGEYFLSTTLACLITPDITCVVTIGDGVVAVNGQVQTLGPFPRNEPPYLAYSLFDPSHISVEPADLRFKIIAAMPTDSVQSLCLGTDGLIDFANSTSRCFPGKLEHLGSVDQFWQADGYFTNPDKIRRTLTLAGRDVIRHSPSGQCEHFHGLLPDDTTLIAIRRTNPKEG